MTFPTVTMVIFFTYIYMITLITVTMGFSFIASKYIITFMALVTFLRPTVLWISFTVGIPI